MTTEVTQETISMSQLYIAVLRVGWPERLLRGNTGDKPVSFIGLFIQSCDRQRIASPVVGSLALKAPQQTPSFLFNCGTCEPSKCLKHCVCVCLCLGRRFSEVIWQMYLDSLSHSKGNTSLLRLLIFHLPCSVPLHWKHFMYAEYNTWPKLSICLSISTWPCLPSLALFFLFVFC